MTDYSDFKVAPILRDVVAEVAKETYGEDFRAISRAGHEAAFAWLVLRADPSVVRRVLADPDDEFDLDLPDGVDTVAGLVEYIQQERFDGDDHFDPLAAVRTPADLEGDDR